jgi:hypothetical protein
MKKEKEVQEIQAPEEEIKKSEIDILIEDAKNQDIELDFTTEEDGETYLNGAYIKCSFFIKDGVSNRPKVKTCDIYFNSIDPFDKDHKKCIDLFSSFSTYLAKNNIKNGDSIPDLMQFDIREKFRPDYVLKVLQNQENTFKKLGKEKLSTQNDIEKYFFEDASNSNVFFKYFQYCFTDYIKKLTDL